jgi:hypothetical protein
MRTVGTVVPSHQSTMREVTLDIAWALDEIREACEEEDAAKRILARRVVSAVDRGLAVDRLRRARKRLAEGQEALKVAVHPSKWS